MFEHYIILSDFTILTLFTFRNLSSYIFQNTTYFLTGLFAYTFF
jgi:hypothetical protein